MRGNLAGLLHSLFLFLFLGSLAGCAATRYVPLDEAPDDSVTPLKADLFRVEYRVSPFTSQTMLDELLRRRCAELTLREGFDSFLMAERFEVLTYYRGTSVTVRMFKWQVPPAAPWLLDARAVLAHPDPD